MTSGIYAITNIVTGEQYIGSSTDITARWRHHRCSLRGGYSRHTALLAAWNEYGEEAFTFVLLEDVPIRELEDFTVLAEREQYHLDQRSKATFSSGYNVRRGGIGGGNTLLATYDHRLVSLRNVQRGFITEEEFYGPDPDSADDKETRP